MIIWSGRGFLVALIAFGCLLFSEWSTEAAFHDTSYYQTHGWPKLMALFVAAVLVWMLAQYWNREPSRVLVDKQTGREVIVKRRDSLFFIEARYWPVILCGVGFILAFQK
jgi:beta-xylosidase